MAISSPPMHDVLHLSVPEYPMPRGIGFKQAETHTLRGKGIPNFLQGSLGLNLMAVIISYS